MASLRPRSIAEWVARNQARPGRPDAMTPRRPMRLGHWMPRCIAISTIKPHRGAWCQRASASSDQDRRNTKATRPTSCRRQLGASISSTALVPCLDGTFVDSALSTHRPPWSLARIGPSLPLSPSSPSHQVGAGDMVPSRPACQGVRCISIARGPGRQAIAVASDAKVPSLYRGPRSHGRLGPRSTKGLMAARDPAADGESAGLIHRGTSDRGASTDLVPRRSRQGPLPGPMPPRSPWSRDQLDTKAISPPRRQGIHAVSVARRPHGLGTSVSPRRGPTGRDDPLGYWEPRPPIELGPQPIDPPRERVTSPYWRTGRIGTKGSSRLADTDRPSPLKPTSPGGLRQRRIQYVGRRCAMIAVRDRSPGNWVYWCDGSLESSGNRAEATRWISAGPPGDGHQEGRGVRRPASPDCRRSPTRAGMSPDPPQTPR